MILRIIQLHHNELMLSTLLLYKAFIEPITLAERNLLISSFNLFWLDFYCSHFNIFSIWKVTAIFWFWKHIPSLIKTSSSSFLFPLLPRQHFPHRSHSTSSCVCGVWSGTYIALYKAALTLSQSIKIRSGMEL